ncbi:MAG: heparinase II/III family protein [Planctomycetota bacterium]
MPDLLVRWAMSLTAVAGSCGVPGALASAAEAGPGPAVLADWKECEKYRDNVVHPAATVKPEDLRRAKENIQRFQWAQECLASLRSSADRIEKAVTREYLERMIEPVTPGSMGPCPACRDKGLAWHPNGDWDWSPGIPDQLKCRACGTVFPNDRYPESVVVEAHWGKGQKFSFAGGETFKCFGYTQARPSFTGIIRGRKVGHVTGQLRTLAAACALTGEARYARAAKAVLLRFAEVFPEYLVRAGYGYGETADMDPHVAAQYIQNLPADELVYPPNKPDRKIFTGYWSASRIGTSGMDGSWVVPVAESYDLTCTAEDHGVPVYSREERVRIERDVLLESVWLAVCDPGINNKSVGNRAGAAVVGMCLGHPALARFGLEGLQRTVDEWFLPDGGTSESPAYALMTMNGLQALALAFRGYSEPPGFPGVGGKRLDGFNAFRDTRYGDCWQGLLWTLQGDLRFPPSADSYRSTALSPSCAELLAMAYPTDEHLAFLKAVSSKDVPSGDAARSAMLYREPGLETREAAPLHLPDILFPFLAQGILRTGQTGRDSLVLLNASDWGNHHHQDSLNLYYWKDGHELLSDLGYLWDHPDKHMTTRTLAHNLVLIDEREQLTKGRGGCFQLFSVTPRIKVMEASSNAYGPERTYRRTCVLLDHGAAGSCLVDVFRASGGQKRDYVFHGPSSNCTVKGLALPAREGWPDLAAAPPLRGEGPWSISWQGDDGYTFEAFAPGSPSETVLIGKEWGQRDHKNSDRGVKLAYVVRRSSGAGTADAFVSVFAGNPQGQGLVKSVRLLPLPAGAPPDAVAVSVQTSQGTDLVVSMPSPASVTLGEVTTDGRVAAALADDGKTSALCLVGGRTLATPGAALALPAPLHSGSVLAAVSERGASWFEVAGGLPADAGLAGQTLFVMDGSARRGYPIRGLEKAADKLRVYVKRDNQGFEARPAKLWELPLTAYWQLAPAGH